MMVLSRVVCIILLISQLNQRCRTEDTLQMVMAIFRHGDRTNDKLSVYPKDPYFNYNYYPYGYGQLTDAGKEKMYTLGKKLRQRYTFFLDPDYSFETCNATSTKVNRARESLLMVMAGLFPSLGFDWNKDLSWTSVPFIYDERITHIPPFVNCWEYQKLYKSYMELDEVQKELKKYEKWFPFLSRHTGIKINSLIQATLIHHHLKIQEEMGMKIPLWSFPLYPYVLRNASIYFFKTFSATNELRQLHGGKLLKNMVNIMKQKIDGTLSPSGHKLFLYSGHDLNVLALLNALNAGFDHIPPYGACVILELHKKEKRNFLRILYDDATNVNVLQTWGCTEDCPFDKFLQLINHNLPQNDSLCNDLDNINLSSLKLLNIQI